MSKKLFRSDLAELMGISDRTLKRMIQDDTIPPPSGRCRLGGQYWLSSRALTAIIKENRKPPRLRKKSE